MVTKNEPSVIAGIPGEWKKLPSKKVEGFKKIVEVLNKYYARFGSSEKTEGQIFRESFVSEKGGTVFLKKAGAYEYVVYAKTVKGNEATWLHVCGISQERDELLKQGVTNHPVFGIECVGDLWGKKKMKEVA